jgi:class 3 adenylate cyclase
MRDIESEYKHMNSAELMALGQELRERQQNGVSVLEHHRAVASVLIDRGEPLLAFELLEGARGAFPDDVRLLQLMGLALARGGATEKARLILDQLYQEELARAPGEDNHEIARHEETLSMLARTYKDLGLQASAHDPTAATRHWEKSLQLYLGAYSLRVNHYPGVNAATVAALLGRNEMARKLAAQVAEQCLRSLDEISAGKTEGDAYWLHASLGEAYVMLDRFEEAGLWYGRAAEIGLKDRDFGSMGSTVRQLKILTECFKLDPTIIPQLFPMPRIAVFAGHMVDLQGRPMSRFPSSLVPRVQHEIRAWLDREDIKIGYSSAACGADLLFLEALLERGGDAHVILPFERDAFCTTSVAIAGGDWTSKFNRLLEKATVQALSGRPLRFGEVAYDYANQVLHGLAIMHANRLETELRHLVVWDGQAGDGPGGTADVVHQWHRLGCAIDVIPVPDVAPAKTLADLGWNVPPSIGAKTQTVAPTEHGFGTKVVALLFADVVHFSKLNEEQIPLFVGEFLQLVANLLDEQGFPTEKRNTWGDGLYVVFDHIDDACRFALVLSDQVRKTDWAAKGLPPSLGLRTALHAGPVYLCIDPITQRPNCLGTHVSRTARIEPITPSNEVYASRSFAALAFALGIKEFTYHYVGHINLPKESGLFPIYHVRV